MGWGWGGKGGGCTGTAAEWRLTASRGGGSHRNPYGIHSPGIANEPVPRKIHPSPLWESAETTENPSEATLPATNVIRIHWKSIRIHSPGIENYLGLKNRQGLADVLAGTCDLDSAVRTTSVPGVQVMGAGTLPDNPSQLLGSERMRTILGTLKRGFSYVLIDTPEALRISDASLIGGIADGIVLVVRLVELRVSSHSTGRNGAETAMRLRGGGVEAGGNRPCSRTLSRSDVVLLLVHVAAD